MNIRALRAEDYVAWLRLWQGYQQFYQTEIDEATTGETFRRMLSRAEPMYCLVLEHAGGKRRRTGAVRPAGNENGIYSVSLSGSTLVVTTNNFFHNRKG